MLPKQARYQLRHISLFFFRSALLALLRFPKHPSAYRLDVSTAAIRSAPFFRHRRRSPRSPKAHFRQLYTCVRHLTKRCFAVVFRVIAKFSFRKHYLCIISKKTRIVNTKRFSPAHFRNGYAKKRRQSRHEKNTQNSITVAATGSVCLVRFTDVPEKYTAIT